MRDELRIAAWLVAAALVVIGCGSARPQSPPIVSRGVAATRPVVDPRPYGAADTAFGLDVLGAWCRADPRANLVLSPSSLASGLGMAYLGARGGTARTMASVLRLPVAGGQALEAGLQARSAALGGLDSPGVTLAESDQVWADPSLRTLRSYLNAVATGYGAGVGRVPLLHSPDQAAQEINHSIAAATRGQIPQLLSPDSLQSIGWVLTDALYLHADWATPFGPARPVRGRSSRRPAAGQRELHARWCLPHRQGRSLDRGAAPLPRRQAGDGGAAASLRYRRLPVPGAAALGTITARLAAGTPAGHAVGGGSFIALPKVNLSSRASMKAVLSELGMGIAFSQSADFAGLAPQACCIGLVEHAATLRVGEEGTVASAATAVGMAATAARVRSAQILFDRPYLLLVTDTATGEPLFLARVAKPGSSLTAGGASALLSQPRRRGQRICDQRESHPRHLLRFPHDPTAELPGLVDDGM